MAPSQLSKIRELNDQFRRTQLGGMTLWASGVAALPEATKAKIIEAIRNFNDFDDVGNPCHEHDFVAVEVDDLYILWECRYFDLDMRYAADDPSDPTRTKRVATIYIDSEY